MVESKIIMLSPHHADCDYRVRRVINVMHQMGLNVDIYWDERYPGHQITRPYEDHVREFYYKNSKNERLLFFLRRSFLNPDIETAIKRSDIVYVNASAIEGLFYAREAKRLKPDCKVVYDYHDSITYELYYQLSKRGLGILYTLIWPFYRVLCAYFAKSVDALVGISNVQVDEFPKAKNSFTATAVVPNFRKFDDFEVHLQMPQSSDSSNLIWLGQVMRGRDLEKLSSWIADHEAQHMLHVYGKVIDESAMQLVTNKLKTDVVFYGEFTSEAEILDKVPCAPIGVFLGWEDPAGTNINAHASPNKYFTYINMGIPVIIADSLIELACDVTDYSAGIAVSNQNELAQAVASIEENYFKYAEGVKNLKEQYIKISPEYDIQRFLEKTLEAWR